MPELKAVYATTYANNVYNMAQQQGSLLYGHVTHIDMKGEKRTIERAHATRAVRFEGRAGNTPDIQTKFSRRVLYAHQYHWGELLDWTEEQGMNPIIDPTGSITMNGAYAMGRCLDEIIIRRGLNGIAYEVNETGGVATDETPVALPASQKVAASYRDPGESGSGNTGLTLAKLIKARSILGKSMIPMNMPGQEVVMAVCQSQLDDLLRENKVQSADYNTIRALVTGEIDTFMGFKFIKMDESLLPMAQGSNSDSDSSTSGAGIRCCFAWLKSNVVMAEPQAVSTVINTRPDKCNAWQVYSKLKAGSTRYEDGGVVKVMCAE